MGTSPGVLYHPSDNGEVTVLFQWLESFPKLTSMDHVKLCELGDLLTKILSAKEAISRVCHICIPHKASRQSQKSYLLEFKEKWLSAGSKYKEENNGPFPPFEYFCRFVCYEAKKQNDPSFMHQGSAAAGQSCLKEIQQ